MFWLLVVWAAVVFGVFFGGTFVYAGARRVLKARAEANPTEARIWGTVGVLIGCALLSYAAWIAWGRIAPPA